MATLVPWCPVLFDGTGCASRGRHHCRIDSSTTGRTTMNHDAGQGISSAGQVALLTKAVPISFTVQSVNTTTTPFERRLLRKECSTSEWFTE
jgi:hypothetical protein